MKNIFLKKNKNILNKKRGFSLVEVLVACAIISLTIISLMSAAAKSIELSYRALKQVQASLLIEEGVEAVKSIRDNNWDTISVLDLDTEHYLSFDINTNKWSLSVDPTVPIDEVFTRKVIFSSVACGKSKILPIPATLLYNRQSIPAKIRLYTYPLLHQLYN